MSQKKYDMAHTFSSIINLLVNPKSIDISVKDTHIIYFTINPSVEIGTRYGFHKYYYFKDKIVLLLSSSINLESFNTDCSVILCDITFFSIQSPNTLIQKMVTLIMIRDLRANKLTTDQYAIIDIYILDKNNQKQKIIAHI